VGKLTVFVVLCLAFLGCNRSPEQIQTEIAAQEKKFRKAETEYDQATIRLREMQDSLQIKIRRSVDLNMSQEQAEAEEQTLIKIQQAIVKAAGENLERQKDYLALLKKMRQDMPLPP